MGGAGSDTQARETISIQRIAIIGAGLLGRGIASLCSGAGYSVALEDVLPSRLRGAARQFDQRSEQESRETGDGRLRGLVEYAGSIEEAVRDADLVIDCVPDELESKLEILSLLDRMAPPRTILATPTVALSIADLASCIYRPERCLALQLPREILENGKFARRSAVRIVHIAATLPAALDAVLGFWRALGFEATAEMER